MKLAGDYRFEAAVQEVWDALFDPAVLAAVLPGCERLERVGEQLVGEIKVKIGPVSGAFAGKVDFKDVEAPRRYTMVIDGRGSAGFVKATAVVELEADGEATKMRYQADAQVGGKLASVGERLIDASTKAIVKEALAGLHTNVKIRAAAYKQAASEKEAATETETGAETGTGTGTETETGTGTETETGTGTVTETGTGSGSGSGSESGSGSGSGSGSEPGPAPPPADPPKPAPAPPAIEYAKVTQGQMAGSVAKEVARSMWPIFLLAAVVVAALIYLLVR